MERALGVGLADLALTWDPQYGHASAAPNAQRRPGPRDSGISQSLERKAAVGGGRIIKCLGTRTHTSCLKGMMSPTTELKLGSAVSPWTALPSRETREAGLD